MEKWEQSLADTERDIWRTLGDLRNADVHVEPVPTNRSGALAVQGRALVVHERKLVVVVSYVVQYKGRRIDAFQLAEQGLPLLRRFIADFDTL